MKRTIIIGLLVFCVCPPLLAQKGKQVKMVVPEITIDSALSIYDFGKAESLLNAEILKLRKKKESTLQAEQQLQYVHKAMQKMSAVEKVVVFDSLVIDRNRVLDLLCLSKESGRLHYTSTFLHQHQKDGGVLFQSEMGDKIYYAATSVDSVLQLYSSDIYGTEITPAQPLAGLDETPNDPHNYPYMMADGTTLYFAAQGTESLGGYDIFMTRYDADEQRFLTPENIGMPFNSAANDYLFCIDEYYNIGCFVSDRNMPVDSVCVYYFIPNATRRVYIEEEVGTDTLRMLARLSDIRLTWDEELQVRAALARLQECRMEQEAQRGHDFTFRIADNRICHTFADFTNPVARQKADQWLQECQRLTDTNVQLEDLRRTYAVSHRTGQEQLRQQILELETQSESLRRSIKEIEKEIRRTELGL